MSLRRVVKSTGTLDREDLKRLETVFASIRDGVIITELDGTIILANPAVELILGLLPVSLFGKKIQEMLSFECAKNDVSGFLQEALAGWRAIALPEDCAVINAQGKPVQVGATATPLYSSKGAYAGIVLVLRDLTEERQRKRRQFEFLSFICHQFRRPLGDIRWGIELILEGAQDLKAEYREVLGDLHAIVLRFKNFITDLIEISRLEEGKIEVKKGPCDLRAIIETVVSSLRELAVSKNVTLVLFPELPQGETFMLESDRARLDDIFTNLFSNAIVYNRPGGKVTLRARNVEPDELAHIALDKKEGAKIAEYFRGQKDGAGKEERLILVSLLDTGIGIPKEDQPKVFEFFFRARNAIAQGTEGTGIGLFVVKSLVEMLGGKIFFESKENAGTTFYVVLPLLRKGT